YLIVYLLLAGCGPAPATTAASPAQATSRPPAPAITPALKILGAQPPTASPLPGSSAPLPSESPTLTPAATLNPTFTQTLAPEITPTLTAPTARPAELVTSTRTATSTQLPLQASSLLYLSASQLKRWTPATQEVSDVSADVAAFSVSASGRKIALLQKKGITANGVEQFALALLDLDAGKTISLLEKTARLYKITISPDGQWVAYALREDGGPILAVRTDGSAGPAEIGGCILEETWECRGPFTWLLDSRSVLWSDSRGIWIGRPGQGDPFQVTKDRVEITDPRGQKSEIRASFETPKASPDGRYLLTWIHSLPSGVRWLGLVDTWSGLVVEAPELASPEMATPAPAGSTASGGDASAASAIWMRTGGLLAAHPGSPAQGQAPFIETWAVLPAHPGLLVQQRVFALPAGSLPGLAEISDPGLSYTPAWLAQINDHLYSLGITQPGPEALPTLFTFDSRFGSWKKISILPYDTESVAWSPDASGALVLGWHDQILFAPADGSSLIDLRPRLGEACCFAWLPPARLRP
ncbi:MAG TPA: hypothetical protein VF498_11095, partial [Anaerolineales bacterium]